MGWAKDVADLIVRDGHFRLNIHDAVRMREFDEMEQRLVTEEKQLADSQAREAELRKCLELYADKNRWHRYYKRYGPSVDLFLYKLLSERAWKFAKACLEKVEGMK